MTKIKLLIQFFCIILLSMLTTLSIAQASKEPNYTTVYLGVIGPGTETTSAAGHVFLLFSEKKKQFLTSKVYSYTVDATSKMLGHMSWRSVLENIEDIGSLFDSIPFVMEKIEGWNFLKSYNHSNRYVHLHHLKLNTDQVKQLIANLEVDFQERLNNIHYDYDILKNNCATKIYDHINSVVNPKLAIQYRSDISLMALLHLDDLRTVLPLSASEVLEGQPIVLDVIKFRSENMASLETNLIGISDLDELLNVCHVHAHTQKHVRTIYAIKENSEKYLVLLNKLLQSCLKTDSRAQKLHEEHIAYIRFRSL